VICHLRCSRPSWYRQRYPHLAATSASTGTSPAFGRRLVLPFPFGRRTAAASALGGEQLVEEQRLQPGKRPVHVRGQALAERLYDLLLQELGQYVFDQTILQSVRMSKERRLERGEGCAASVSVGSWPAAQRHAVKLVGSADGHDRRVADGGVPERATEGLRDRGAHCLLTSSNEPTAISSVFHHRWRAPR
jgi:hypothetical protein